MAYGGNVNLINNTIVNNYATGPYAVAGGGISVYPGSIVTGVNNIIYFNQSPNNPNINGTQTLTYSCWPEALAGTGNITDDPQFVDPANNNYNLHPGSPCIDAGDPTSPLDPDSTIADMGCYFFDQHAPDIELSAALLDFGIVTVGEWADLPLTIYNVGSGDLVLYDVFATQNVFTTNWNPADSLILPGDSLEITVTFTPTDPVAYDDVLTMDNNDELLRVRLSGQGEPPPGIKEDPSAVSREFALHGPYPNPFNATTTLSFNIPKATNVTLSVYDLSGRVITTLLSGWQQAGIQGVTLNATGIASGIYICRLQSGQFTSSRKIMLLK